MNQRDYDERLLRLEEGQAATFDVLQSIVAMQRQMVEDQREMAENQRAMAENQREMAEQLRLISQHQQQTSEVLGGVIALLTQIQADIVRIESNLP